MKGFPVLGNVQRFRVLSPPRKVEDDLNYEHTAVTAN